MVAVAALAGCRPSGGGPGPSCSPTSTTSPIYNLVNNTRAFFGVPRMAWNGQLGCLAAGWSQNMSVIGQLAHRDLNAVIRLPSYAGFRTMGENILRGPTSMTSKQIHDTWMASSLHRNNILNRNFTMIGIGIAYGRGQVWATENFGG